MRGDELRVVDAFVAWLQGQGWTVSREVQHVDIYAERDAERLYAEAKGRTTAPGLDVDTLYGQLLRPIRRPPLDTRLSYPLLPSRRHCVSPAGSDSSWLSTCMRWMTRAP